MIYKRRLLLRLLPLSEVKNVLGLGLILPYVQFFILFCFSDKFVHVIKIIPFCYITLLVKIKDLPILETQHPFLLLCLYLLFLSCPWGHIKDAVRLE